MGWIIQRQGTITFWGKRNREKKKMQATQRGNLNDQNFD